MLQGSGRRVTRRASGGSSVLPQRLTAKAPLIKVEMQRQMSDTSHMAPFDSGTLGRFNVVAIDETMHKTLDVPPSVSRVRSDDSANESDKSFDSEFLRI